MGIRNTPFRYLCVDTSLQRKLSFYADSKQRPKHIKYFKVYAEWAHALYLKKKKKLDFQEERCFGFLCHLAEE